jgi:hypothetical protein
MKVIKIFLILNATINICLFCQNNNPYNYLKIIAEEQVLISEKYLDYASAVAHGKSARKVEKRRIDLIKSVLSSKDKIASLPCFDNDCKLRDSLVSFLTISYYVLNFDYEKIVNMEEVAEQSYDLMEEYMNAREKASDKVEQAGKKVDTVLREFAKANNVTLSDKKDALSIKMERVSKVNKHYNEVFLIFFKSYKQEAYLSDALNRKDFSSAEQNRNALLQVSNEGLSKLDTLHAFLNDRSLIMACHKALDFYKTEAKDKIGIIIDFMLKNDNYEKLREVVESKDKMSLTKEEVANYNNSAKELNNLMPTFNSTKTSLNQNRLSVTNNWNNTAQNYLEKYIPKTD